MGWLQPSHMNTAMGTPQMRWRLMHQSGRVAIMLVIRSLPQAGSQMTLSISSMVSWRNEVSVPSARLHGVLHVDEPLFGGPEDHRVMAAPAVWVGVLQVARGQQGAILLEHGDDDRVGLPDGLALEGRRRSQVPRGRVDVDAAAGVDARGRVEAILLAGVEVVGAMRGRGVHCAGAGVGGNVGGQHAQDAAVEERMLEGGALELAAL